MKKIFKTISIFMVASIIFTSCEDDNDNTNASLINYSPATVTLSSNSNTVFDESAIDADDKSTNTITITATIPSSQPVDAVIDLVQSGGTASSNDFSAGTITIPAGSLTASADVEILQTGDIEGSETLQITGVSRANFNVTPFTFSASIENDYINDVIEFSVTWKGSYTYKLGTAENTFDFCSMDFDVALYDDAGARLDYIAATGDCLETGSVSGLPDGDYYIVLELYGNPAASFGLTEPVPITVSYSQEHFQSGSFVNSIAANLGTPKDEVIAVAILSVSGYNYTVTPF